MSLAVLELDKGKGRSARRASISRLAPRRRRESWLSATGVVVGVGNPGSRRPG